MPLPIHHPVDESEYSAAVSSLGTTPLAVNVHAGKLGRVTEVGVIQNGALTGSPICTVVAGGVSTVLTLSATANTVTTAFPSGVYVNEDDLIVFTPSGGTGATVGGVCFAKVRG